ncbi:2-oxoglutaramate amidase [Pelotomaculum schinkii]|uniref:2-oxoglutaramate amidase n=1 Tax=Pelotomaculum schinkii TaxID=78350 RepID=A0A4Y7R6Q8_9FIRM|nr:carbon-nitrogen family hydrolase [Pelotomaculum schinkii]TEB04443.1 2-oxoglutaramate amidase [Pelotomaculum schinkii]
MKIATIQLANDDKETKSNRISRVEGLLEKASGADLFLLPEMWNVGYFSFDNYMSESETLEGETISWLASKAKELQAYIFSGSIVERNQDNKLYNASVLLDPEGNIIGHYRKIHLFGFGSAERAVLSPGQNITVVNTRFGKIGLSICYDLRFPELYRKMADQGAEIILNCAAWPYPRVEHWVLLNKARAIENQCYFLSCCCAGASRGKPFIGRSQIIDPWGTVVASASERETILNAEIQPEAVAAARKEFTALKDRVLKV